MPYSVQLPLQKIHGILGAVKQRNRQKKTPCLKNQAKLLSRRRIGNRRQRKKQKRMTNQATMWTQWRWRALGRPERRGPEENRRRPGCRWLCWTVHRNCPQHQCCEGGHGLELSADRELRTNTSGTGVWATLITVVFLMENDLIMYDMMR